MKPSCLPQHRRGWPGLLGVGILALLGLAGCERLDPTFCNRPGRCPPGTVCDPSTNTCLAPRDRGAGDSPLPAERALGDRRPEGLLRDAAPTCVGGWTCIGTGAGLCHGPDAPGVKLRNCPGGRCAAGHCLIPAGARECLTNLYCPPMPQIWFCTWLLEGGKTPRQVCAPAVAGAEAASPCTTALDCATGLCTSRHECYHACNATEDCLAGHECVDVPVDIEGHQKSVKTCSQNK